MTLVDEKGCKSKRYELAYGWDLVRLTELRTGKLHDHVTIVHKDRGLTIEVPMTVLRDVVAEDIRQEKIREIHHMSTHKLLGLGR